MRPSTLLLPMVVLVLFGSWPFVSFLNHNFDNHNQDDALIFAQNILVYAVAFLILLSLFAVVAKAVFSNMPFAKIANVLAAAVVVLFNYFTLDKLLSGFGIALGTVKIAIWLVILIGVVVVVWRLSKRRRPRWSSPSWAAFWLPFPQRNSPGMPQIFPPPRYQGTAVPPPLQRNRRPPIGRSTAERLLVRSRHVHVARCSRKILRFYKP